MTVSSCGSPSPIEFEAAVRAEVVAAITAEMESARSRRTFDPAPDLSVITGWHSWDTAMMLAIRIAADTSRTLPSANGVVA